MAKRTGSPFNLFHTKDYDELKRGFSKLLLGHNRYATQGKIDELNAHPFLCGHIVGAHNGTLDWHADIKPKAGGTDSEAIFQHIADHGVEATLPKLSGAWCLVWYDLKDKTLNMIRNEKRPMSYVYSKDRKTIIWASEERMLDFAFPVAKRFATEKEKATVFGPPENVMLTWSLEKAGTEPLDSPVQTKLEGKPPYVYQAGSSSTSSHAYGWEEGLHGFLGFGNDRNKKGQFQSKKGQKTIAAFPKDRRKGFRPPYTDVYGTVIGKTAFMELVQEGCCMCGESGQAWEEPVHILGRFTTPRQSAYMCERCAADEEMYEIYKHSA